MNGDGEARPHRYGRHTDRASGEVSQRSSKRRSDLEFRPYRGEHYYGLPVVKPSPWGWLIASYFFLGGLAGAAQVVATVADLFGGPSQRPVVRTGRYLALAGTLISPVLLILDLHTPTRWYNMLRIARPTSPMSIGSWVLSAFGFSSSIAAATHFWRNRTQSNELAKVDRIAGILGAVSGAAMSTYTATLLSSTSTPLWLTAARPLPVLFGSTAIASAIAAIDLILGVTNPQGTHRRPLSLLGLFAAGVQLWSSRSVEQAWGKAGSHRPAKGASFRLRRQSTGQGCRYHATCDHPCGRFEHQQTTSTAGPARVVLSARRQFRRAVAFCHRGE